MTSELKVQNFQHKFPFSPKTRVRPNHQDQWRQPVQNGGPRTSNGLHMQSSPGLEAHASGGALMDGPDHRAQANKPIFLKKCSCLLLTNRRRKFVVCAYEHCGRHMKRSGLNVSLRVCVSKCLTKNRLKTRTPLLPCMIPKDMKELILNDLRYCASSQEDQLSRAEYLLESRLSSENYFERFQLLLFMEEVKMEEDIRRYNMDSAPMKRDRSNARLLTLKVPGVSEKHPFLLRGDQLLVRPVHESRNQGIAVKYQGYVHQVELDLDQVKLGFSLKLLAKFDDGMKFSVELKVNRLTLRTQHRAAAMMSQHGLGEVLFPTGTTSSQQTELPSLKLFDRRLEQNPEQYKAVQHIVAGSSKPAPYLVFGPPGTGKTVTVVEAIKQIEKTQGSCHILACAPTNSSADLLCKKILEDGEAHSVFRLYASSYSGDVPFEPCFCNMKGNNIEIPSRDELKRYKIIVTTLLTASRLVTGGIPKGHYTHIFIDEAQNAVETMCIIPLAGLLNPVKGQVVLVGDPKQLGPIIMSHLARNNGMGLSLLERLMNDFNCYQKFDDRFVTKLLKNYRSHSDILKFPSERFYDNELVPCAEETNCNYFLGWEHLPNKDFPVIFHEVEGEDENSPSFCNKKEVKVLVNYVEKLLQTMGRHKIEPKDIGIIAPYRKQVEKIRMELRTTARNLRVKMDNLKVSTVEKFQGDERKVILVSAVRSNARNAQTDQMFSLGFINNDKKFNVAMTRAQALLIVVGNPRVLKIDDTWREFIQYCRVRGGYCGNDSSNLENEE